MIFHWALWAVMAVLITLTGAMYRGQEAMLMQDKVTISTMSILVNMPIRDLGEIHTGKI